MKYRVLGLGLSDELVSYSRQRLIQSRTELVMAIGIQDAVRLFAEQQFHMVVADLGHLKNTCREDLLAGLRGASYVPIIVLTDNYTEDEAQRLIGLGVDLVLPCGERPGTVFELAVAQLRRYTSYNNYHDPKDLNLTPFQVGDIFIDPARRRVEVLGRAVELRAREFALLLYFMQNPRIVLTAERICEAAWGKEEGYGRGVGQPIRVLRSAIEPDPSKPIYIETVYGAGYRFTAHSSESCGENL